MATAELAACARVRACVCVRTPGAAQARDSLKGGGACFAAEGCSAAPRWTNQSGSHYSQARSAHTHALTATKPPLSPNIWYISASILFFCLFSSSFFASSSTVSSTLRPPSHWLTQLLFSLSAPSWTELGTCPPTCTRGPQPRPKASPSPLSGNEAACSTRLAQVSGGRLGMESKRLF